MFLGIPACPAKLSRNPTLAVAELAGTILPCGIPTNPIAMETVKSRQYSPLVNILETSPNASPNLPLIPCEKYEPKSNA